ncbi:right-handed parallel beta-helix repeat-containing protein [Lacibacter sp. H407]|uniref:right-handed parallel beta-helix repeat-containing protein n=1 Tax=Lacibacter sp. H407 TaxID=3133423 RepID=UPI0030BAAC75
MSKQVFLLFLLFFVLLTDSNAQQKTHQNSSKEKILVLKELGTIAANDATPIVVAALKTCKKEGISKLEFPKGIYHFYPTFAPDFYCAITNNDNGLKRTPFPLIDFDGLEIDGNGSEFIFHGKMLPFIIQNSSNLTLKNFSIDWQVAFTLEGKVVANNPEKKSFDIEVSTPHKVQYGHLYLTLEREKSPYENKYGFRFAVPEGYDLQAGQNILWDPETMAPYYNTVKYDIDQHSIAAEELKKGLIRLSGPVKQVPPVGSVFVTKGAYLYNRTSPAFWSFKSKNLLFNNINVHHAGAMGLIAERSENITLDGFNVVLKKGSGRMVTTTADATHFCNVRGEIIIRNCVFENMLDDATNIHGTYVRVNRVLDDRRVAVETYHPHQNGYLFGEAGDSVRIIESNTLQPTATGLVLTNVERVNEKISILTFNKSIKGKVDQYYGIENISWYPTAIIENNIVRNNRARGFLVSVPRKVIVRNNHISSQMAAILVSGDLALWNESGPTDSLIIENNTFENCAYGGNRVHAIFSIEPDYVDKNNINESYSRNIFIRNNQIKTFDSPILLATSVDGIVFEGNTIEQTNAYEPLFPNTPNLKIVNCNRVVIGNNTYKSLSGKEGTLSIDEKTTNVDLKKNKSFAKLN